MAPLNMTFLSIHSWHDAAILLVLIVVIYAVRVVLTLAKRVTHISLQKREVRFKPK